MPLLVCVVALVLAALTAPSAAQTEIPASQTHVEILPWGPGPARAVSGDPVQIRLDAVLVERLLASLPALTALARNLDGESGRAPANLQDDLAFLLLPYLSVAETKARIGALLEDFGFASYDDWANVAFSVSLAMHAAEFTGALDLASQEQAALRDIRNSRNLSEDQKAQKLDEMKSQFAALAEFAPLPGNREAVAPYLERLRAAMGG